MTDINRLPRNWAKAMKNAAAASEAVRNILMSGDPAYEIVYTHFLGDALPSNWGAAKTNGTSAAKSSRSSILDYTGKLFGGLAKGTERFLYHAIR